MYDLMKDFDSFLSDTGFISVTGLQRNLVFYEALFIPELDHTLINPNQLRQFYMQVQDNPYHAIDVNLTVRVIPTK